MEGIPRKSKTEKIKQRLQIALEEYLASQTWFNKVFRHSKILDSANTLLYRIRMGSQWLNHVDYEDGLRELLHKAENSGVIKYDLPPNRRCG